MPPRKKKVLMAYDAQKSLLKDAFLAAVEAVQPHHFMTDVAAAVTARFGTKPVTLMALGKAAGAMAEAYLPLARLWRRGLLSCLMMCQLPCLTILPSIIARIRCQMLPANKRVRPYVMPPRRENELMRPFTVIWWGSALACAAAAAISCRKQSGE